MKDGINACVWGLEIDVLGFIYLSFCFSIILFVISKDSSYIANQYTRNWNSSYVIDISLSHDGDCPPGFELEFLGLWSGFKKGSCYCTTNDNNYQVAGETQKDCDYYRGKMNYNCYNIPKTDSLPLFYYKNVGICLKRDNAGFNEKWDSVQTYIDYMKEQIMINEGIEIDKNFQEYVKFLNKMAPSDFINPEAIVDIKILNVNTFSVEEVNSKFGYDLSVESGYSKIKFNDNYTLFYKRISSDLRLENRNFTIFDINKVITDIHFYNDLWCSYLDISSPLGETNPYVNFGDFKYCEDMYINPMKGTFSSLFYNDNFKRTERINFEFDNSVSLDDLYSRNGILDVYNNIMPDAIPDFKKKNRIYGDFEPILVYEKYFYGFGCFLFDDINSHLEKMKSGKNLQNMSKAFTAISFVLLFLSFIYKGCRMSNNCARCPCLFYFFIFLMLLLILLSLLITFSYAIMSWLTMRYLDNFSNYCQMDFTNRSGNNAVKTNNMEIAYRKDLYYPHRIATFLSMILFITFIFMFILIINLCKIRRNTNNNLQPIEERSIAVMQQNEMQMKNPNNNQFNDLASVDKSELGQKI